MNGVGRVEVDVPGSPTGFFVLDRLDPRCRRLFLVRHLQHPRGARLGDAGGDAVKAGWRDDAAGARVHILKYARVIVGAMTIVHLQVRRGRDGRRPAESLLDQRTRALSARLIICQMLI